MSQHERSGRRNKRLATRILKQVTRMPEQPLQEVMSETELLGQEEDLGAWNNSLQAYRSISRYTDACLRVGIILNTVKLPDQAIRDSFSNDEERALSAGLVIGNHLKDNRGLMSAYVDAYGAMKRPKGNYTNDEFRALWELMDDADIHPLQVLREIASYASGMRDMTQMQVDWLRKRGSDAIKAEKALKKKTGKLDTAVNSAQVAESGEAEVKAVEGLELGDRQLFATSRRWSIAESDLEPVRTSPLADALVDIRDACRSGLTIKPISVANALVFSTRQDVRARSKTMKLNFAPDEINEWMRIPRGRDQVVVREVDVDNARQMIFFVADAETIIRDARRK